MSENDIKSIWKDFAQYKSDFVQLKNEVEESVKENRKSIGPIFIVLMFAMFAVALGLYV